MGMGVEKEAEGPRVRFTEKAYVRVKGREDGARAVAKGVDKRRMGRAKVKKLGRERVGMSMI